MTTSWTPFNGRSIDLIECIHRINDIDLKKSNDKVNHDTLTQQKLKAFNFDFGLSNTSKSDKYYTDYGAIKQFIKYNNLYNNENVKFMYNNKTITIRDLTQAALFIMRPGSAIMLKDRNIIVNDRSIIYVNNTIFHTRCRIKFSSKTQIFDYLSFLRDMCINIQGPNYIIQCHSVDHIDIAVDKNGNNSFQIHGTSLLANCNIIHYNYEQFTQYLDKVPYLNLMIIKSMDSNSPKDTRSIAIYSKTTIYGEVLPSPRWQFTEWDGEYMLISNAQ